MYDSASLALIKKVVDDINYLNKTNESFDKIKGQVGFGITSNKSAISELSKISSQFDLKKGIFPLELNKKSNIYSTFQNKKLQESISDIYLSLDYNFNKFKLEKGNNDSIYSYKEVKNSLMWEGFTFLNRFTNSYLNIDQRYEGGIGILFNIYSLRKLKKEGDQTIRKIKDLHFENGGNNLSRCIDSICEITKFQKLSEKELDELAESKLAMMSSIIKQNFKFRFALLSGIYFESESASISNKIEFAGKIDSLFSISVDPTTKLRWEIRPTLELQLLEFIKLRFDYYFKMRLFGGSDIVHYRDAATSSDNLIDKRSDNFHELISKIEFNINDKISISTRLNFYKDFAPKRIFLFDPVKLKPILIVGQDLNRFLDFTFNYKF